MKMAANSTTEKRLFFGNLPRETTVNDLQKLLKNYPVSNVEIKRKNALDQESVFAYVNIPETHIQKCLQEYQSKDWNGSVLKVEIAKESFLERLRKERSQRNENSSTHTNNTPVKNFQNFSTCSSKNKKIVFSLDDDNSDTSYNDNSRISNHSNDNVNHKSFKRKFLNNAKDNETDFSADSEDEIPCKRNLPMFRGINAFEHKAEEPAESDYSMKKFENFSDVWKDDPEESDRKTSTLIKWKNFPVIEENEEIPAGEKKIVKQSKFSAENKRKNALEERWKSIKEKKAVIRKAIKIYDTKNKKIRFSDIASNEKSIPNEEKSKKITLFDENSSDDDFEVNFKIREELEGKNGMKLLKLKSKLSNDERFKIDERFLDDDSIKATNQSVEESSSKNDRLNNILQNRSMIRYDPTKPEHKLLEKNTISKTPNKKKKKKVKKKPEKNKTLNEEIPKVEVQKPEVSKEKHYSVADTLKDAFKKDDAKSEFRLSSLFDEKLKKPVPSEFDTKQLTPSKKIKKVENPFENLSESDDNDIDGTSADEAPINVSLTVPSEKVLGKCGIWGETFFFKENDSRLAEAVNFYKSTDASSNNDFAKRRHKLRSIIRKKIQTSKRENREFKQKLGGINQKKFKMRLKKARS